jgi:hypothetical protein
MAEQMGPWFVLKVSLWSCSIANFYLMCILLVDEKIVLLDQKSENGILRSSSGREENE